MPADERGPRRGSRVRDEDSLLRILREEIQAILGLAELPASGAGLFDLGADSVDLEELRRRLNRRLGGSAPVAITDLFDYPSASALAEHLAPGRRERRGWPASLGDERGVEDAVAVVGVACRFPGGGGLAGFRRLLESGGTAVEEGKPGSGEGRVGRLFRETREGPDPRRFGAFVPEVEAFDAAFFGISDAEAELMDPQHRLLLEVSWHALEDAGIVPSSLRGSRTGVVAGVGTSGYGELLAPVGAPSAYAVTGTGSSVAVGRVAYLLGFEGPAFAVETASSSSLVAMHQGVRWLLGGEADVVLAGGVNVIASGGRTEAFVAAGMLSPEGRCLSYDAAAAGYVRGEGCGMVVLRRLRDAEAAGDRILGVLRGSAVNQDGASAGLTAPRGAAQTRLIAEALARAGWEPADVDYLEGHGSGTPLGDPIEVAAALSVYGRNREGSRPLLLGSVKGNVGHLEAAAGVAGLLKVLVALGSDRIPGQAGFSEPNPRIAWEELPVRVVRERTAWPGDGRRRRAGVSSFGLSGTNAHLLVEGYERPAAERVTGGLDGPLVLPLSAKTPAALSALAGRYREWLDSWPGGGGDEGLRDLAWTATVGREALPFRAAVVFGEVRELRAGLAAVASGKGIVHAEAPPKLTGRRDRSPAAAGTAEALARAWESGAPAPLARLFGERGGVRVAVPEYPFEGRRYWPSDAAEQAVSAAGAESEGAGLWEGAGSEPGREERLREFLRREVQALLRLSSLPPADAGFFALGLDSLGAAELRSRLNRALGGSYEVAEADMFSYPDAGRLAAWVAARLRSATGEVTERAAVRRRASVEATVAEREPIAVVGMGCRFPGGGGVEGFWRRLERGEDLVTRGRPDGGLPGGGDGESERWGAYVEAMDRFDAEFFRIAPVEAELLDPQQRLLLEVSWEALEDAGIAPGGLRGTRTGVYAGMFASDYQALAAHAAPGLYRSTGTSFSAAIGRVAFSLGLEGAAVAVDTACSSSLVAVHQAVSALERGEVELALAGGVNAILTSELTEAFAAAGMLSAGGRCRTFDASADGYVRGEGCGMVVLMGLSRALREGHRVQGLVLGSAVNQDGASAGLTAPNGLAQERVIAEALSRAGIPAGSVDYLEAHGTGTPLGDPIELEAAATAYGEGREAERPLRVGSVKTNLGHLEAAAGVAGLIKVLLALREEVIPRHLHFVEPNPRFDWAGQRVRVVSEPSAWVPEVGRPRRAGLSSFGYSGTNAHLIVEGWEGRSSERRRRFSPSESPDRYGPPEADETRLAERGQRVLPLSAKTEPALRELAGRYLDWLTEEAPLADTAWTAGVGRSHFAHRAGVVFRDRDSLHEALERVQRGTSQEAAPSKVAFLYTGQGSQWTGMGRALYESEPVFRELLDRCEAVVREERGRSLRDVMFGEEGGLDGTEWTQPALYALQSGLTALWASVGVRPDVVFGHSVGEVAAAQAAGVFQPEQGLRFALRRGKLMGSLPPGGAMAAVFAPAERVVASLGNSVFMAAENGAHQVVSGPEAGVAALAAEFRSSEVRVEELNTSHAFHSALMDPVLEALEAGVEEASPSSVPLVAGVSGRILEGAADGAYWRRQAREPVRFATALTTLAELGVGVVIEIGPHGVLGPMASLGWPGGTGPAVVPSLMRGGTGSFAPAVAGAYEAGVEVSFSGLFAAERRRRVSLPTYPFQRKRYWVEGAERRQASGHPLLGLRRDSREGEVSYETDLFAEDPAWLQDHRVFGAVVAPAALYAAQAFEALREAGRGPEIALGEMQIQRPLVLTSEGRTVQVVLGAEGRWEVVSRERNGGTVWDIHAEGRMGSGGGEPRLDIEALRRGLSPVEMTAAYRRFAAGGIEYGPAFRGLRGLWAGPADALGELMLPAEVERGGLVAHPALLDGCFQVVYGVSGGEDELGGWLPIG